MEHTNEKYVLDSGLVSFDPIVLVLDLLKRWLLVVVVAITLGVGAYVLSDVMYTPQYQANATLVVTSRSNTGTVFNNLSSANSLANVFTQVLNSSLLRKTVLQEAGITQFDGSITAKSINGTNLMTLHVVGSNPRTVYAVARAVIENHEELTYQIIGDIVLEVLQEPMIPSHPINSANSSRNMRNTMLIAALAVSAFIMYLSFSRDAVRSNKEVRKKLDCHLLGEIPHENKYKTLRKLILREKTGIVISNPTTSFHFTENIHKLRRRMEQRMGNGRVLMVTSVMENEGKSTVAVNTALALAQKYDRVLLLESDLRKPACHTIMNQKPDQIKVTVKEVLLSNANPEDAVIRDRASGLYMMLDPKGIRNPGDLLGSKTTGDLIQWCRDHFDFVVMDLPPMSVATDAESVLEYADGSMLVIRQNIVRADALNRAIVALKRGKAKFTGCVLNNVYSSFLSSGQGVRGTYYAKYRRYGKYGNYVKKNPEV
jgi:capsular exopolysaccharide synthesis family protein